MDGSNNNCLKCFFNMRIIAHRGLTDSPNKKIENTKNQIENALALGFDCEVDLWKYNGDLYLGHDEPGELISEEWLKNPSLWVHAKNENAMEWLNTTNLNYFWHETDHFTLTSKNKIWVYIGKALVENSICVMPEKSKYSLQELSVCYAVCTDFPKKYNELFKSYKKIY